MGDFSVYGLSSARPSSFIDSKASSFPSTNITSHLTPRNFGENKNIDIVFGSVTPEGFFGEKQASVASSFSQSFTDFEQEENPNQGFFGLAKSQIVKTIEHLPNENFRTSEVYIRQSPNLIPTSIKVASSVSLAEVPTSTAIETPSRPYLTYSHTYPILHLDDSKDFGEDDFFSIDKHRLISIIGILLIGGLLIGLLSLGNCYLKKRKMGTIPYYLIDKTFFNSSNPINLSSNFTNQFSFSEQPTPESTILPQFYPYSKEKLDSALQAAVDAGIIPKTEPIQNLNSNPTVQQPSIDHKNSQLLANVMKLIRPAKTVTPFRTSMTQYLYPLKFDKFNLFKQNFSGNYKHQAFDDSAKTSLISDTENTIISKNTNQILKSNHPFFVSNKNNKLKLETTSSNRVSKNEFDYDVMNPNRSRTNTTEKEKSTFSSYKEYKVDLEKEYRTLNAYINT